jgi:hypothetical protein
MRFLTVSIVLMALASAAAQQPGEQTSLGDSEGATLRIEMSFTGRFTNASARDVLSFVGDHAGIEVRFAEGVKPSAPITLKLEAVPVVEVFKTVLKAADLGFKVLDERTILIAPPKR